MYEIIKEQWDEGCYSSPSDLDVYVQAGWITKEQEEEITAPKAPVAPPVVEQPTSTAPSSADTSQASTANSVAHI